MYSWVFFDWDGCIADTLHLWVKAYEQTLPRYGVHANTEEIWKKLCIGNVPKQFSVTNQTECTADMLKVAERLFGEALLYDNARDSLTVMADCCQLGIVSNSTSELLYPALSRHQLERVFSSVIAKEDVAKTKPHPEGILKAMELLQAEPHQTLFVGDSHKDLEAARQAGIDSALFYPKEHEALYELDWLKQYRPAHVVRGFKELEQLVMGQGVKND